MMAVNLNMNHEGFVANRTRKNLAQNPVYQICWVYSAKNDEDYVVKYSGVRRFWDSMLRKFVRRKEKWRVDRFLEK
jgi:hypothetical protein